jgi:putative hydrolase of the HAD superfamily
LSSALALLFDLDETLVVDEAAIVASFRYTAVLAAEAHARLDAPELAATARRRARELWHSAPHYAWARAVGIASGEALWGRLEGDGEVAELRAWAPEYRAATWRDALADQDVDDPGLAHSLALRFAAERRSRMWTYPDAAPVLTALAERHPLALVTNGMSCLQREKLAASGLEECFRAVIVSGDLGVGKPDPAVFAAALEALGAPAEGAVMIGDSLKRDIDGALGAGLRAVWINRLGVDGRRPGVPEIRTLDELPALLSGLPA